MDRRPWRRRGWRPCVPRARGDGPTAFDELRSRLTCSPRTRGWTVEPTVVERGHTGVPRARGDGPPCSAANNGDDIVFPAHAGMDRWYCWLWLTGRTCSPRTRGWTALGRAQHDKVLVFPAHAGMDRAPADVWNFISGVPRARGDGPSTRRMAQRMSACSPRTRGWTDAGPQVGAANGVFPAHAGMDRNTRSWARGQARVPRARGDGPKALSSGVRLRSCSPRTRGWTV